HGVLIRIAPSTSVLPSNRWPTSPVFFNSTHLHHPLWRDLLVYPRVGAAEPGCIGPSCAFAGIEDDSRGSRVAHLPGLETVVDRASQSRDGAGCRRRIGIGCGSFANEAKAQRFN